MKYYYGPQDALPQALMGLYDGLDARTQYLVRGVVSGIPIIGSIASSYWTTSDNVRYMDDYLRNSGMNWSDIKYYSRALGYGTFGGVSAGINFVSKNLERLYE